MLYVFENGSVVFDGNILTTEEKNRSVKIKEIPEPEQIKGKIPILKVNKAKDEVYYEYIDNPQEDLETQLEKNVENLELEISRADFEKLIMINSLSKKVIKLEDKFKEMSNKEVIK